MRFFPLPRLAAAFLAVTLSAGSAAAHQVWIEQQNGKASFYFGEFGYNLREISPGLLDRMPVPQAALAGKDGTKPLSAAKGEKSITLDGTAGKGESITAAVTDYPAFERKNDGKTVRTVWTPAARYISGFDALQPSLALDIVPTGKMLDGKVEFQVTYKGKPLPKAEVEIVALSGWALTRRTGEDGTFAATFPWKGPYVIETKHKDETPGKRGAESYDAASYVTSLSFTTTEGLESPAAPPAAKPN
ncbi:DUF4198 domain-containing protein [Oceanibaculum indicum]|uniref:Cobalt ABC transporter substrate-binding protein n=1 Tax=Oceanibaculum indicum P24 TaxID=1207063 RepID=K2J0S2_9PROT|nr:DUF4198 domain-containing protein [Oceanibaculum indicum]EKE76521.1 hypothetical protein P24_07749 [Oceanibaculum indicum P24]